MKESLLKKEKIDKELTFGNCDANNNGQRVGLFD